MSRVFTSLKVDDLRDILIGEYGYTHEEIASIRGKTAFVNAVKQEDEKMDNLPSLSSVIDNEDPVAVGDELLEDSPPLQSSPEWNDYVLGKLLPEESYKGNPTVDGLRRITELLLGEIVEIDTEILQVPSPENERRATVKVSITIDVGDKHKSFCGVGDSYSGNTDRTYQHWRVSCAETRAEGRAYKKALKLRKVVTAEELNTTPEETPESVTGEGMITDTQISFIEILCKPGRGMNINIQKFVDNQGLKCNNIRQLAYTQSLQLQSILATYQQNPESIPPEILGFDNNWRTTFC